MAFIGQASFLGAKCSNRMGMALTEVDRCNCARGNCFIEGDDAYIISLVTVLKL